MLTSLLSRFASERSERSKKPDAMAGLGLVCAVWSDVAEDCPLCAVDLMQPEAIT